MKKISILSLCIGLVFSNATFSSLANDSKVVADPVMSDPQASEPAATKAEVLNAQNEGDEDAYSYVESKASDFVISKQLKFAKKNKHVMMFYGVANVAVPATHKRWSDARVMAYQQAQHMAREQFISELNLNISSETIRDSFDLDRLPSFSEEELQAQSKIEAVLDKLVALADATIDSKLREAGVDPTEYKAAEPSKRKRMVKDSISKRVKVEAYGDISGSQIMKSYEKTDQDGNTAIAVVIASSVKKKNFLMSLRVSRGNVQPDPSKAKEPILEYLQNNKSNLMYQFGTRVLWDEKGYPVLASFGLSGNDCNPNDKRDCARNRQFSYTDAKLDAYAHLSESYNLNGNYASEKSEMVDQGKAVKVTSKDNGHIETVEESIAEVMEDIREFSSMTSSVKGLKGVQEAMRWSEKHPVTNKEVNGIVLIWHPLNEQNVRAFQKGKELNHNTKNAAKMVIKAGAGEGDEADDEDF